MRSIDLVKGPRDRARAPFLFCVFTVIDSLCLLQTLCGEGHEPRGAYFGVLFRKSLYLLLFTSPPVL